MQKLHMRNLFSPNIVWALVPAVSAALVNAAPTLRPVERLDFPLNIKAVRQISSL
jgi:hypothetical protein